MNRQDIDARVREFYELLLGDLPEAFNRGLIDENILWENFLPEDFPFGGAYSGRGELETYLAEIGESIEINDFQITNIYVDDQTAIVTGLEQSNVHATGKPYTMDWVHILRFNDHGAIEFVREYNDTARMAAAFAA
ncbi:MAG: nuclear transport factor 2 family protein [Rhodospirillales bacterium]|nr:nuclear transport factor 2 family protein [Rhodospirillales bacterium]